MSRLILGENEGQCICSLSWPFVRYEVLIPEQIKGDLFVWLYLSLVVYKNEQNNQAKNLYTLTVKEEVKKILIDKFGKIIDAQTLEKIVNNAEKDFVVFDDRRNSLKAETFGFLETYEELFSDKLQIKHIFQDAVTGDVVPDFSDEEKTGLEEFKQTGKMPDYTCNAKPDLKKPTKTGIYNAYKLFQLLQKGETVSEEQEEIEENSSPFDEFDDEEKQQFFDTLNDEDVFEEAKPKENNRKINIKNYAIRYYDAAELTYDLKVDIYVERNKLVAISPFGDSTFQWMNRCLLKARNVDPNLDAFLKEQESLFLEEKDESDIEKYFGYKDKISDQLKWCGPLFRLVCDQKNNELKKTVLRMNDLFDSKIKYFFGEMGLFLEYLIEPYKRHNLEDRKNTSKEALFNEIKCKCQGKSIDFTRLLNNEVYKNWLEGWDHFKADIADIIISTNITDSNLMYYDFINDLFDLYGLRNTYSHKKKMGDKKADVKPSQEHLDKLLKVSKVIMDIH